MSKVVIIGSGLGGLSCGFILQRNGYDVTILEQGFQAGGCLQCFSRQGVKFETGMHFIGSAAPGQTIDTLMNYFGMKDSVKLSSLDPGGYNTVCLQGDEFRFPVGREAFMQYFSELFPSQKDALARYLGIIDEVARASSLSSLTSASRDIAANTLWQTMPLDTVMEQLFTDPLLRSVLVGDLPLYAARKGKTPFSLHAFIMDFYNRSAFRVVGGSDSMAAALVKNISSMGGQVLTGKKVVRIVCDDEKAVGVETAGGEFFPADQVVSTVHPARLVEMLDTKLIRPAFRMRMNSMPQTPSIFAVYVKFKEGRMPYMNTNCFHYGSGSPWGCDEYTGPEWPKGLMYMHMCHEDKARWARSGVVMAYMDINELSAWKGTCVGHRGGDYEDFKRSRAERLIAEVEKFRPGFASAVESYFTSSPLTYSDYTGTEDGAMYGVARDISLGAAGHVPYRTRIPNLLLAGQNVNSHGMLGVLVGTIVTCSCLVKADELYRQIFEK